MAVGLTGCGKSSGKKEEKTANNEAANGEAANKPDDVAIGVTKGSNRRTGVFVDKAKKEHRVALWQIAWDSANLAMIDGKQSGSMFKVTGKTYIPVVSKTGTFEDKVASEFSGDKAEADKDVNRLVIEGNVKVVSYEKPKATMIAKKVEWFPDLKMFKASGDVQIETERGFVGPVATLYADASLKQIATSKDYIKVEKSAAPTNPSKK